MVNSKEDELSPLQRLAWEFSKCRNERRRYSAELKARAVEMASSSGTSRAAFCKAAGVSSQSLSSWKKSSFGLVPPRELRVRGAVQDAGDLDGGVENERMVLRFGRKIEICLPVKALTFDLLERLHKLGGAEC